MAEEYNDLRYCWDNDIEYTCSKCRHVFWADGFSYGKSLVKREKVYQTRKGRFILKSYPCPECGAKAYSHHEVNYMYREFEGNAPVVHVNFPPWYKPTLKDYIDLILYPEQGGK